MGATDSGIDRDVPVDQPGRVCFGEDRLQGPVPGAVFGVPGVALPHCLPRAKLLARQVSPGNPCPVAVNDAFDDLAVVSKRMPLPPRVGGQQGLDPFPLLVGQLAKSRLRPCHSDTVSRVTTQQWETRPSAETPPTGGGATPRAPPTGVGGARDGEPR